MAIDGLVRVAEDGAGAFKINDAQNNEEVVVQH